MDKEASESLPASGLIANSKEREELVSYNQSHEDEKIFCKIFLNSSSRISSHLQLNGSSS
ncbi:MAG: hypothetical protein P4L35_16030 [Ignavibacteriaceae bacterium]|nr:hypothetical protein [Ignavibacteriaceae bacterium]